MLTLSSMGKYFVLWSVQEQYIPMSDNSVRVSLLLPRIYHLLSEFHKYHVCVNKILKHAWAIHYGLDITELRKLLPLVWSNLNFILVSDFNKRLF